MPALVLLKSAFTPKSPYADQVLSAEVKLKLKIAYDSGWEKECHDFGFLLLLWLIFSFRELANLDKVVLLIAWAY